MLIPEANGLESFILRSVNDNNERNSDTIKGKYDSHIKVLNIRQKEVLVRLAKGMTVYSISKELGISEDTVRFHKKNIFDKLDVNCTVQAVVKAIKQNYIKLSDI